MTHLKNAIKPLSRICIGLKNIEKEIKESDRYIDRKLHELNENELLLEDAEWLALLEYEKGYLAGLKVCRHSLVG